MCSREDIGTKNSATLTESQTRQKDQGPLLQQWIEQCKTIAATFDSNKTHVFNSETLPAFSSNSVIARTCNKVVQWKLEGCFSDMLVKNGEVIECAKISFGTKSETWFKTLCCLEKRGQTELDRVCQSMCSKLFDCWITAGTKHPQQRRFLLLLSRPTLHEFFAILR